MPPLAGRRAVIAVAIVVGSTFLMSSMTGTSADHPADRSIGGERVDQHLPRVDLHRSEALAGNPDESSFGTLQEDGTYCGVTCAENH